MKTLLVLLMFLWMLALLLTMPADAASTSIAFDGAVNRVASPLPALPNWSAPAPKRTYAPRAAPTQTRAVALPVGPVVITECEGGNVDAHMRLVNAAIASGQHVRIDAPCKSAGTLWLRVPPARLCVTARTNFFFHRGFLKSSPGVEHASTTRLMMNALPAHVRQEIALAGGLRPKGGHDFVSVPGPKLAPVCQ